MNKNMKKALAAAAVGAAAGVAVKKMRDSRKEQEDARISAIEEAVMNNREYVTGRRTWWAGDWHPWQLPHIW